MNSFQNNINNLLLTKHPQVVYRTFVWALFNHILIYNREPWADLFSSLINLKYKKEFIITDVKADQRLSYYPQR
ncbi:hypothetical protein BpHYR1_043108 [Brachionus plicatilis]|uniref:Uncharacterized protein n=1 Tax=Brachionus plicatilis TaxID=10195 RepID=A0A3M7T1Z5_BRAPC|nr:hypothetical protein BpHYR1_043108 [Brachionus plicatilis]